jgi:protein-S-isoprenylcysteine O-methyltransferase Ste14
MKLRALKRAAFVRFSSGGVVLGALLFGTAGTFRYWEGWVFLATLFIPVSLAVRYLFRHDPELMERRLRAREERPRQKGIVAVSGVFWLMAFLVPGLDHRFGWSTVPALLVLLADALVLGGYLLLFLAMRENAFASRAVQVDPGQTVISTGPYALVRHPMYLGISAMLLSAPLALGSYWAILPASATPLFLVLRILDEEEALLEELPGYREYTRHTTRRLIPWVW